MATTIVKRPPAKQEQAPEEKAQEEFENKAPDGAKPIGTMKGNKRQISHTITPELLARVDAMAAKTGNSRASLINLAIYRAMEHGLLKE